MNKKNTIIAVLFSFTILETAWPQFIATKQYEPRLGRTASICEELKSNLTRYFRVEKCEFADSLIRQEFTDTIGAMITTLDSTYKGLRWQIRSAYSLYDDHKIVLITVNDPNYIHFSTKWAYNVPQKKFYLLGAISNDDLNSLFATEQFSMSNDGGLLKYCQLITLLKHPNTNVMFIADIKQLLLESITERFSGYDINEAAQYTDIKLDLPTINKSSDGTESSYFVANQDDILRVDIRLKGQTILDYKETKIAQVPHWYGYDFH